MAEEAFHSVTLRDRWQETADLVGVCVDLAGTPLAASFQNPGQFVQVRTPAGQLGYFAIASRPGHERFEFLLKRGGDAADELIALPLGSRVEMSPASGPGYPIQHHLGKDLLLFAVGSGISPIRSLIWYLAAHRKDYAGVTLFYGARTPEDFPYQEELTAWEQAGMQVVRVVSRAQPDAQRYMHGYVQEALQQHPIEPSNTVAFVCGMPAMVEAVSQELAQRGVKADRIFQNY
jgi:NAD(P)H-flavin reductase